MLPSSVKLHDMSTRLGVERQINAGAGDVDVDDDDCDQDGGFHHGRTCFLDDELTQHPASV